MQNWIFSSCYSKLQFHMKLNVIFWGNHNQFLRVYDEQKTEHKSFIKKFSKTIYCHYRSIECILAE